MFVERAAAASGTFGLTAANQYAVAAICRQRDGLPLAIELAAVRTRVLTPEQVLDRVTDRFELLTGRGRAAVPRHKTLRACLPRWVTRSSTPRSQETTVPISCSSATATKLWFKQSGGRRQPRRRVGDVLSAMGVHRADIGIVVTNSKFTPGAIREARANSDELWDRDRPRGLLALPGN